MSLHRVTVFGLRPISPQDEASVLDVYRQCEDFLALGPEPKASLAMVRKDIAKAQREGARFCGIVAANGTIIGVVEFLPSHFEGDPQFAFLSLLMIAEPYRHQGVGASVVQIVENEIRQNPRIAAILSAVQVNNPYALRFWRKNGYHVVGKPQMQPDKTTTVRLEKRLRRDDLRDEMSTSADPPPRQTAVRLAPASLIPPAHLREMLTELGKGENGFSGTPFGRGEMPLEQYLQSCVDGPDPAKLKPGLVPQTIYWLLDESGTAVGMVRVRHCLNDWLLLHGGHIGFFIRTAYRGRGYGKLALRLALGELRKLGEKRALLTVNENNTRSIRTIRACGGVLENVVADSDGKTKTLRFWVALDAAPTNT